VVRASDLAGAAEVPNETGVIADDRLLRLVDWRFLLPTTTFQRSVSFGGEELAGGLKLISDEVVPSISAAGCDLAVARDPSASAIRASWKALDAGGVFYAEWTWRSRMPVAAIEERLRSCGYSGVASFWPWPLRPPHQVFVPLGDELAIDHFLALQPMSVRAGRRVSVALRRRLWSLCRKAGMITPVLTIATKPRDPRTPGYSLQGVPMFAAAAAPWLNGDHRGPRQTQVLVRTPGFSVTNTVIAMVFEQAALPTVLLKTVRRPELAVRLRAEADALARLSQFGTVPGAPRVLGSTRAGGLEVLAETYLTGEAMHHLIKERSPEEMAVAATDWVATLGLKTRRPSTNIWSSTRDGILGEFEAMFGRLVDPSLMSLTRARLSSVGKLPIVFEHRDFAPWNILLAKDGSLAVLDWESARSDGVPGLDLAYFVTYLGLLRDGASDPLPARAAYRRIWTDHGVGPRAMRRYATVMGLQPEVLRILRLLLWPLHAKSEYERMVRVAGSNSSATLASSLFLALWEEEAISQT
jgi:hypothetical protein